MDRKDEIGFDLSKIMQEFSAQAPPASLTGKHVPEVSDEPSAAEDFGLEEVDELSMGDTIRLDAIQKAVVSAMTVDAVKLTQEEDITMAFEPVQTQEAQPDEEPFDQNWEPDYLESDEDFQLPEPVIQRPKSRLRELRQKLVSGPEQRYYALSEQGIGKIQLALIFNGLLMLLSIAFTTVCTLRGMPADRLRLVVFVQFLTMLVSALLGCYRLIDGVIDMIRLRFTPNSLLVLSFLVCCVDGVIGLQQLRLSVCAVFSLQMTMALWAAYDRHNTEMGQMDTLRRATNLSGLACVPDDYEGMMGFRICRGEVEHFMDHYQAISTPDRMLNWFCLAVAAASLVIGAFGGLLHGFTTGIQLCCASLMVGFPATGFLATVRPMEVLEKRLHKLGTVLCGWQGIQAVRCRIAVPLNDKDLFPSGAVKLNGVKFYGDREPDQVVTYTAALIGANGGALVEVFEQLRDSRGGKACLVENLHIYKGGVGGEIGDDGILVGTLQFLQDMGVDVGKGTRVSQAVYTAIDGELAGVFAVAYGKSKSSAAGVRTICGCRSLVPVMTTKDFMITESFIRSKFAVSTRRVAFPDRATCVDICARREPEEAQVVALTTKEGLASMAFAITGARALGSAMHTGVMLHMIGGIVGLLIMAALAYIGADQLLSPLHILLYQLVWMVPGFLVTEWTRTL
jgi:hypothetical protein